MKINVKSEKIIKAVKKLYGIEIELETLEDAREAIDLILKKMETGGRTDYGKLREIGVTSLRRYETSAVDYKMAFLLTFIFQEDASLDTRIAVIKDFQDFFEKL